MVFYRAFIAIALLASAASLRAAEIEIAGTTIGRLSFARPQTEGEQNYPVSSVFPADMAPYAVDMFRASSDGQFHIASYPIGGWNNFVGVYRDVFDPARPLANLIFFNDNIYINGIRAAGNPSNFIVESGVRYLVVTTGVEGASGDYRLHLAGRGTITVDKIGGVPEPATWGLMVLGFGLIGAAARGRRRRGMVA